MPGKVIQGHAKYETECRKCHIPFDKAGQSRLCLDCHKEVAADVRGKTGLHGRQAERDCRACHSEHKGRAARIAEFDQDKFDHARTDYPLRGSHA
ncbi:MAG: cytochrome c3 family protein, partial [Hydrogenophilaceae bacterium]